MTKNLTKSNLKRIYLARSWRGSSPSRRGRQGSWRHERTAWTASCLSRSEAESKGRKWGQTANLKSNPSLPHSCFLQLDPVSEGFHNLPKTMLPSGNQVFRRTDQLGTFCVCTTAATDVGRSHQAKSCTRQAPVWAQLGAISSLSSYLKETKMSPGLPQGDGP